MEYNKRRQEIQDALSLLRRISVTDEKRGKIGLYLSYSEILDEAIPNVNSLAEMPEEELDKEIAVYEIRIKTKILDIGTSSGIATEEYIQDVLKELKKNKKSGI